MSDGSTRHLLDYRNIEGGKLRKDVLVILGMNEKATNYTKKVVGSRMKPTSSGFLIQPKCLNVSTTHFLQY